MVCPTAATHAPSKVFPTTTPLTNQQTNTDDSSPHPEENPVNGQDAWELFSAEAQLNSELSIMKSVEKVFDHPSISNLKHQEIGQIISQANGILLQLPASQKKICIDLLCSITQKHPNCNPWRSHTVLQLLELLVRIPPPFTRQEKCVAFMNEAMRGSFMQLLDTNVVRAFEFLCSVESRLFKLTSHVQTFDLFLQLLPYQCWPASIHVESLYNAIKLFDDPDKIMQYTLALTKDHRPAPNFHDVISTLEALYQAKPEERDRRMESLQYIPLPPEGVYNPWIKELRGIYR